MALIYYQAVHLIFIEFWQNLSVLINMNVNSLLSGIFVLTHYE